MPYFITDRHPDCDSWALVKEDGELIFCHPDQEAATNHMIAISLAEDLEPGGEYEGESFRSLELRELPDNYRPANSDDVPEGRACGNCMFYRQEKQNEEGLSYCERWEDYVRGDYYCNAWEENTDYRQVDLTPPAYMRAAARRGVELYEQGLAGDGVTDATVREARAMAQGNVTAEKWSRIAPWIARHIVDLEAEQNQLGGEGFPGAGAVAFYLWGATPTPRGAARVQDYAEGVVSRIEEEARGIATGESMSKLETRTFSTEFEIREEADGMRFSGYAALFDSPSAPLPFTERIAPGAFKRSLKSRNNIFMFYNHDSGQVLASTRAGTMTLTEDSRGLKVDAQLANTSSGRDVAELLKRGDLDAMSFGFSVPTGGDSWNDKGTERTLKSVRLFEVSVVAMPAYPEISGMASVRGLDKIALRADVDADALADALVKLETGEDISEEDKTLLSTVIDTLSPKSETEETEEEADNGKALLELKKKKLALLMKENL
jgi:uncharacterized protein